VRLDGSYAVVRHAKPMRCPSCKRRVAALLFDSQCTGMVYALCHAALMAKRLESVIAAKRWRPASGSMSLSSIGTARRTGNVFRGLLKLCQA
jgi:hypothetical protein